MTCVNINNKKLKNKNYIKKTNLFLFIFINNFSILELIIFNRWVQNNNFKYLTTSKIIIENLFINSIYVNFKALKDQTFILISLQNCLSIFRTDLKLLPLKLLAFKLNKKFYNKIQLKNIYSFYYRSCKILVFKFIIANLKIQSK